MTIDMFASIVVAVCLVSALLDIWMFRSIGESVATNIAACAFGASFVLFLFAFTFGDASTSGNQGVDFFGGLIVMFIGSFFLMWPLALAPTFFWLLWNRTRVTRAEG